MFHDILKDFSDILRWAVNQDYENFILKTGNGIINLPVFAVQNQCSISGYGLAKKRRCHRMDYVSKLDKMEDDFVV